MKKFVVVCVMMMTIMTLYAQEYVGVQLGYARSITRLNSPVVDAGKTLTATPYDGLKIGVVYDATLIKGFGFTMGLNYTLGANATAWVKKGEALYPKERSRGQYHQLEIPIDWQYKFEIAQRTWLMLYTGPTLQCGLAFTKKNYVNDGKQEYLDKQNPTDNWYSEQEMNDQALKRINVTWGIGAGFQYERYFLRGGYDFGIINPYKAQSFSGKDIYTRGRFDQWQIKLGMYLWEK